MIKGQLFTGKSVFSQFLIYYMCMLLIPVIICGSIYLKSLSTISNEINRTNTAILKQIQQTIDSRLGDLGKISETISMDQNVINLLYLNDYTPADSMVMSRVIKSFSVITSTNDFIKSFFVYFRSSDIVLTPICSFNGTEFLNGMNEKMFEDPTWSGRTIKLSDSIPIGLFGCETNDSLSLVYYRSLPITDIRSSSAVIAIYLNTSEIRKVLESTSWINNGSFLIVDQENQILYSNNDDIINTPDFFEKLVKMNSANYSYLDGKKVVISQIDSEIAGLKFVSVMPYSTFHERINYIRILYIISLAFCLLLGGIFAVYFTKKNYNPLREIMQDIRKITGLYGESKNNEYRYIRETLLDAIKDKEETQRKMQGQKTALKKNFMSGVVTGNTIDKSYILEGLEYFNINFYGDRFVIMVFNIDDFNSLITKKNDTTNRDEALGLARFIVINIADELLNKENKSYMLETEDGALCLINVTEESMAVNEGLKKTAFEIKEFVEKNFEVSVSIAISNVYESLSNISKAYREAIHAMEYRILVGSGKVIHFNDIMTSYEGRTTDNSLQNESQQLANCLKCGDIKTARELLDSIINNHFYNKPVSIPMIKCRMFGLINVMISALEEMSTDENSGVMFDKLDPVDSLLNCKSIVSLQIEMKEIMNRIEIYMEQMKNSKNDKLKSDIVEYISIHFFDPNLNVSTIADYFSMSVDGISRFFKKSMNKGLLSYINEFRIKKALELLQKFDIPVKDIAEKVGFSNSDAFIRVFKKVEGVTPGRFREM